ncbi:unnamed protein product [Ilex paraguariensis]|uniref:Uncharacterized protein n=1 Tax=Ilex paraguariensis TaxID=185542 RepID=A0ABC8RLB7_9AQUA
MVLHPAVLELGQRIYSARAVRFRFGHAKSLEDIEGDLMHLPLLQPVDDKFIWTYMSVEFPMAQVMMGFIVWWLHDGTLMTGLVGWKGNQKVMPKLTMISSFFAVIANGLCKQLCVRMFPQLSSVAHVIETSCCCCKAKKSVDVESSNLMEWEALERDHRGLGSSISSSYRVCIK